MTTPEEDLATLQTTINDFFARSGFEDSLLSTLFSPEEIAFTKALYLKGVAVGMRVSSEISAASPNDPKCIKCTASLLDRISRELIRSKNLDEAFQKALG